MSFKVLLIKLPELELEMNKILSVAFLIFLAFCGSSEAETQERIDEGVEEAVAG